MYSIKETLRTRVRHTNNPYFPGAAVCGFPQLDRPLCGNLLPADLRYGEHGVSCVGPGRGSQLPTIFQLLQQIHFSGES